MKNCPKWEACGIAMIVPINPQTKHTYLSMLKPNTLCIVDIFAKFVKKC